MIAGAVRREGDVVAKETILRREPQRLGSLLRNGNIEEITSGDAPPINFKAMSKPAIKQYATEHRIEFPEGMTAVADMREFMTEYAKGDA